MKKMAVFLFGVLFLFGSVSAVQYTGCNDPTLDYSGYSNGCVEVTSCGVLTTPDTYYLLSNNISSLTTCIVMRGAHNSALDLNEYVITYNTQTLDLQNPGFEQVLSVSDWTVTLGNPVDVSRIYGPGIGREDYMWGDYYLEIANTQPTEITSNLINIPVADQTYVAYISAVAGPYRSYATTFLSVEDEFGVELCRIDRSPMRAFSSYCSFKPTAPVNVYIKFGTLVSESMTLSFDSVGIASAYDFGVISRPYSSTTRAPDDPVSTTSNNIVIKNGEIIQGAGAGPFSESIEVQSTTVVISDINSSVNGINTNNFDLLGSDYNVLNNLLISSSPYVFNRMSMEGQMKLGYFSNGLIKGNRIIGGPQQGIAMGSNEHNILIRDNYISQNATVTNNHGIGTYEGSNLSFINNTIISTNGRGISCNHVNGCYVKNNYIGVIEKPSMEYYHNFGFTCAHGIKLEGRATNVEVYNNTVISKTGSLTHGGCSLNLGLDASAGGSADIQNNSFTALYDLNSESSTWASALFFYGDESDVLIKNNKFYSNNYFLRIEGVNTGPLLESNTFTLTGPNLIAFRSIYIPAYQLDAIGTRFLNTSFVGGNFDDVSASSYTYNWNYNISWFLDIEAVSGAIPVQGAIVTIVDNNSQIVVSNVPTINGILKINLTEYIISGYGNGAQNQIFYSPYNVSVTNGSQTISRIINLNESKIEIFQFSSCALIYDSGCDGVVNNTELGNAISGWFSGNINVVDLFRHMRTWKG